MPDSEIAIGELSRRTGCNIETIRYYERIGLIPVPRRRRRYRRYAISDVGRLGFVKRARELGFALGEVRALLGLAAAGPSACAKARNLAASHLADVRSRIADLRRMERTLADAVRRCDADDDPRCPLIEAIARTTNG
jgi:MerR family transcriptional regulator, mercuric resistance operon regulatory protein